MLKTTIHKTCETERNVQIGSGTKIWNNSHIRKDSIIGKNCVLGFNTFIDEGVILGNNVKIQNGVSVYSGIILKDFVFCGPNATFVTDKFPRSKFPKSREDYIKLIVEEGATIGGNATIVCVKYIGKYSLIGAGAVVTKDVPEYSIIMGNPARVVGYICECGEKLNFKNTSTTCKCKRKYKLIKKKVIKIE